MLETYRWYSRTIFIGQTNDNRLSIFRSDIPTVSQYYNYRNTTCPEYSLTQLSRNIFESCVRLYSTHLYLHNCNRLSTFTRGREFNTENFILPTRQPGSWKVQLQDWYCIETKVERLREIHFIHLYLTIQTICHILIFINLNIFHTLGSKKYFSI
jgi:hypothetical protein